MKKVTRGEGKIDDRESEEPLHVLEKMGDMEMLMEQWFKNTSWVIRCPEQRRPRSASRRQ